MQHPITQPATLDELRSLGAAAFAAAPEPSFKYGLNVFYAPKDVPLDFGVSDSAPVSMRLPDGVTAHSFADALKDAALADCVLKFLWAPDERPEKIAAWHRSQSGLGTFIVVPPNFSSDEPIRLDLTLAGNGARRVENVLIVVGEGSRVTIVEHLRSAMPSEAGTAAGARHKLRSAVTDVIVHPNAKATHISLQDFAEDVTDFSLKRAKVKANASMTWIECAFGGGFAQSLVNTELTEPGAAVGAKTMFFGRHHQKMDLSQRALHLASDTHSNLRTRGALMDAAKTIYRGLVRVEKGTKACTGHQREDTLLLGEKAEIDAVPNLEIETDDVRCGHAASVGRVNDEQLFYLQSRGLPVPEARKLLVEGFFGPIVRDMAAAGLEDRVQCIIDERIAPLTA